MLFFLVFLFLSLCESSRFSKMSSVIRLDDGKTEREGSECPRYSVWAVGQYRINRGLLLKAIF